MGGIKFEIKGFQKILDNIDKAEKDAERVAKASIEKCADIYQSELMTAAQSANVPRDLTSEIEKEVNGKNGVYTARIGWKLGTYDPKKPSAGYKAMFLNYGTVRRQTREGQDRGEIVGSQFIAKSKKRAKSKIKKQEQEIIEKVMEDIGR